MHPHLHRSTSHFPPRVVFFFFFHFQRMISFCCSRMMSKMKRTHLLMQQLPKCAKCTWGNGNCTAAKICKINITIYIVTWNLTCNIHNSNFGSMVLDNWNQSQSNLILKLHVAFSLFDLWWIFGPFKSEKGGIEDWDTRYLSSKLLREKSRKQDNNLEYKL